MAFPSCEFFRGPVDGGPCSYASFDAVYQVAEVEMTESGAWDVLFQSSSSPVPRVDYFFSNEDSSEFDLNLLRDSSQLFRIQGSYITEGTCVPVEVLKVEAVD
jgi:hypothetical protein